MKYRKSISLFLLFCTVLNGCGTKLTADVSAEYTAQMYEEYRNILQNLHDNGILWERPDNLDSEWINIEENQFAVYDIDADGKDELILIYDPGWTAGMLEIIYDYSYEEQRVREQNVLFPGAQFYDNGVIYDFASHNQGVAGRFWPFRLCRYDPESDQYKVVASVDAWDGDYATYNEYNDRTFPKDADADGNGLVYYVYDVRENENGTVSDIENDNAMDDGAYQEWLASVMGDAEEITLPFLYLTTENIEQIKP